MDLLPAIVEALGLGIWTALQPCPMATNIAAISYLGRRADSPRWVLLAGLLYALGQSLVYVVLAIVLLGSLWAAHVSVFLQTQGNRLMGPVLVLLGMLFLELLPVAWSGPGVSEKMQKRVDTLGIWAALPLGMFFALAFCPVSAAYFFIALFRLLTSYDSRIILPSVYGVGTALPVVVFAVLVALGARAVGKAFNVLTQTVWWVQRAAGVVCLAIGIHYSLKYIFEIPLFWNPWLEVVYQLIWRTS
jgi:cytochrome c biogenesis protein CcdA